MKTPCKDCPDRKPYCHSKCEKYAEFRAEVGKQKEWMTKSGITPTAADEIIIKGVYRKQKIAEKLKRR